MLPLERRSSNVRRFGTFEVDLRARELRKGGIRIRLQDQPFEILAVLIERPGDIVTREELRERLWPAGTFVDFEHSLNAAIKRLRSALGDDADNPRFVETLHRRGYRFIAAVEAEGQPVRNLHVVRPPVKPVADNFAVRLIVLPFANMSNDPTQEYFSDGLTEEMITQIGRLCPGRLGVIARTSSMLFKRSAKSASEIGRELSADYLLEGSVRGDGDRVRITAQLIDTRTEVHLWVETYDRSLGETLERADRSRRPHRAIARDGARARSGRRHRPRNATPHRSLPGVPEGQVPLESWQSRGSALGDFVLRAGARARSGLRCIALGDGESSHIDRQ